MKSTRKTEKLIKGFYVAASTHMDNRIRGDVQQIIRGSRQTGAPALQPNVWRTIMKNRITKVAAAAVIIIAVLVGMIQFGGPIDGASVAWGQVADHVEKIPGATYKRTVILNQGTLGSQIVEEIVHLCDYAVRVDSSPGIGAGLRPHKHWVSIDKSGHEIRVHEYDEDTQPYDGGGVLVFMDNVNLPSSDPGLEIDDYYAEWQQERGSTSEEEPRVRCCWWLFQDERVRVFDTGDEHSLSEEEAVKWFKHFDPRVWTKEALSLDYRELGHDKIDGVDVEGVEVQGRNLSVAPFLYADQGDVTIRFWVDIKTGLPVRYEARARYGRWEGDWALVVDEIHWNQEIDPIVFEPNAPVE